MSFLLKRSGFTFILLLSCFSVLFGYQNCGKVRFDRQEKVGPQCTDAEVLEGTCGVSCVWSGDNRVGASPTSFTGQGLVSGTVDFSIPDNTSEIERVIFDFDDGTAPLTVEGANQIVQHTFSSSVTKQFSVQVSVVKVGEENCSTSQTIIITINTGDSCLISTELSGPNRGLVNQFLGFEVNMTSCPNTGYTIDWDKENDGVVDQQAINNPLMDLAWNRPGNYTIRTATNFPGVIENVLSYKTVIIACPFGSYENKNSCICYSTGQGVPDTGICPPCPGDSDPTTGACVCPAGQEYDPADRRCECPSGVPPVNGSCSAPQCSITINGQTITRDEGEVLTLHRRDNEGAVNCGFSCSNQSRTCHNGQFVNAKNQPSPFDPGYIYTEVNSCVSACGSCNLTVADGVLTAAVGENRTVYTRSLTPACGASCASEVLTCGSNQEFVNAAQVPVINGSNYYLAQGTCAIPCTTCPVVGYPGVTSLNLNQSLTKYSTLNDSACGGNCRSQTLTCTVAGQTLTFGNLYTYTDSAQCAAAIPACAQNCSVSGYPGVTTLAAGASLTGYTNSGVACGSNSCAAVSRSCPTTGGVALTFPSGTQATNAACAPTISACQQTDFIDLHFSKTNNDYAFANPAYTIRVTDLTYSYMKVKTGVRSYKLCHKINGTPSCTSDSQFANITIQPGSGGMYNFIGTTSACNPGNPVTASLYTGVAGYDIFKVSNCAGGIGSYGYQISTTAKSGTASDSFSYSIENLTCPEGQTVVTGPSGEVYCAPIASAQYFVSNVANATSNVTNFTAGQRVYLRGLNVNGASRAQGCMVSSTSNSNLATCSNFTTLGSEWNCSGITCSYSTTQLAVSYYRACMKNPNTGSTACTPTFRVAAAAATAPQPSMYGCYVDTHAWDVSQDGGYCESEGCTGTNYVVYSIGTQRTPNTPNVNGERFMLTNPSLYSITWSGACTGSTTDTCSVIINTNGVKRATAVVKRLSDNQTWTYNIDAEKRTRFSVDPRNCPAPN